jgi:O-antigen/teichoic acid export membrane protein
MPAVVMNLLGTTAITPWVAGQYGLQTAGAFALAVLVLSVPAGLVGQAVGTVLFPKFVELQRGTGVPPHALLRYVESLATLALAAFIPILMLGPALFALVFGESWRIAGIIASILTPWIATNFVSSPLSSLALVKGRFRRVFWVAMIETVARYGSIWAGGIADSATLGFALYSLAGVFICVASVAWILRLSGVDLIRTARCRAIPTIGVIASIATLIFLRLTAPLPVLVAATLAVMTFACFRLVAQARS